MPTSDDLETTENPADRDIRIILADAQPVVCLGLKALLSPYPGFRVVATANSLEQLTALGASQKPDLLVLEPAFPGTAFATALQSIRREFPRCGVLVFTETYQEFMVLEAIRLGVQGFLTKQASPAAIVSAVRTVADGQHYLDPVVTSKVTGQVGRYPERRRNNHRYLTPREKAVLELLAEGLCTRTISESLAISERTVKYHITALLQKMHARNRVEAVSRAIAEGLIGA